jgi:hypothetical protein
MTGRAIAYGKNKVQFWKVPIAPKEEKKWKSTQLKR